MVLPAYQDCRHGWQQINMVSAAGRYDLQGYIQAIAKPLAAQTQALREGADCRIIGRHFLQVGNHVPYRTL